MQPVSNYSIWDSSYKLLNTIQLTVSNFTYNCTSYETSCDPIFPSHPIYAQPYLPVLPAIIQSKAFTWLQVKGITYQLMPAIDIQTDYEKLYPFKSFKQLKYFVALSATRDGVKSVFHTPSDLPNSVFSIIGGVTNVNGEPLLDSVSPKEVEQSTNCDYTTFQLVESIFTDTVVQLEAPVVVGTFTALAPSLRYIYLTQRCNVYI